MNETLVSARPQHVEGSRTLAMDVDTILGPEETRVAEARAGVTRSPEDEKEHARAQTPAEPRNSVTAWPHWTNAHNASCRLRRPGPQSSVGFRGRHSGPCLPEMGDRGKAGRR